MKMGHRATRRGKIAVPTIVERKWTQLCQESIAISSNVGEGHTLTLTLPCVCANPCFVFKLNPESGEEEKTNKMWMKISSKWIEFRWMQGRQYMTIYDDIPLPLHEIWMAWQSENSSISEIKFNLHKLKQIFTIRMNNSDSHWKWKLLWILYEMNMLCCLCCSLW